MAVFLCAEAIHSAKPEALCAVDSNDKTIAGVRVWLKKDFTRPFVKDNPVALTS